MAELTVDMAYGSALYQAASELGKEKELLDESMELLKVFKESPDLLGLLTNPTISPRDKKSVVEQVFQGRISGEMLNMLYILVDKRRMQQFEKIVKAYKGLIDEEKGVSYGRILSVLPLSPEQLRKFEEETGKLLKTRISLENEIEPALIGGVKIFVAGKVFDASLRARLASLSNAMK